MSKQQSTEITEYRPRLPYHNALQQKMGISPSEWNVLVDTVFPAAKTAGAVALAVSYCRARKLDIFKRVVHVVPIWDKERGMMVETVWPGIAEHRTTATRTREYAGHDEVQFGPEISRAWQDGEYEVRVAFPEWAQMTVYRLVQGVRCPFPGPRVRWLETYAAKKTDAPNQMWADRPYGMIEKCAEAAALRAAFPEELGDEPSEVEASGRNWHGRPAVDVTAATVSRQDAVVPPKAPAIAQKAPKQPEGEVIDPEFEIVPDDAQEAPEASPEPEITDRQRKYRETKAANDAKRAPADGTDPLAQPNAPATSAPPALSDDEILDGWKFSLEAMETADQFSRARREDLPRAPKHLQAKIRNMIRDYQVKVEGEPQ